MKQVVLLLVFVFATCNAQKKMTVSSQKEGPISENGLTWIASDSYGGTEQAETLIIKDAKSLKKFYSHLNRTRKPGLPVPNIDFSTEMAIVRCSGKTDDGTLPTLYIMNEGEENIMIGVGQTDATSPTSAVTTPFSIL